MHFRKLWYITTKLKNFWLSKKLQPVDYKKDSFPVCREGVFFIPKLLSYLGLPIEYFS